MDKKNLKLRYQILIIILISVLFGFIAGLIGELWLNDFLRTGKISEEKIQTLTERLDELTEKQEKKLKDILAEKDISISQTIENIRPALVSFYASKKKTNTWEDILLTADLKGNGVVMTADGWILTDKSVLSAKVNEIAVTFNKNVYSIDQFVCDKGTDACFVKISASDLPVANLANRNYLSNGQTALAVSINEIFPTSIESLYYSPIEKRSDFIRSSEIFYQYVKLTENLENKWLGAPVVNLDGQVFGIISSDNLVIAIDDLQNIIKQAISESKITRNYLGINYFDLSEIIGWEKYDQADGALIFGAGDKPAVIANSPAQKAGLIAGDIIISVEDEFINQENSLTSLIQSYKVGQEISLKILRDSQEMEKKIVLTEW